MNKKDKKNRRKTLDLNNKCATTPNRSNTSGMNSKIPTVGYEINTKGSASLSSLQNIFMKKWRNSRGVLRGISLRRSSSFPIFGGNRYTELCLIFIFYVTLMLLHSYKYVYFISTFRSALFFCWCCTNYVTITISRAVVAEILVFTAYQIWREKWDDVFVKQAQKRGSFYGKTFLFDYRQSYSVRQSTKKIWKLHVARHLTSWATSGVSGRSFLHFRDGGASGGSSSKSSGLLGCLLSILHLSVGR